jgi:hypothetical protein
VAYWATLTSPAPYQILDASAENGSPTDPQTQLSTLAYYYLLADPSRTFLDFYGGEHRHAHKSWLLAVFCAPDG